MCVCMCVCVCVCVCVCLCVSVCVCIHVCVSEYRIHYSSHYIKLQCHWHMKFKNIIYYVACMDIVFYCKVPRAADLTLPHLTLSVSDCVCVCVHVCVSEYRIHYSSPLHQIAVSTGT